MEVEKILKELRRLKVETGSLACLGCGRENSCSTKGCAVIRAAIEALEQMHSTEPLTPEEIKAIDYARVWISYGESGEWGIVVNGLLYSIDTLEGAGFVDMLQDAVQGEDVTRPTGSYKLYRWSPKRMPDNGKYKVKQLPIVGVEGGIDVSVQELIQRLRTESLRADRCTTQIMDLCMEAAEVLECVFSGDDEEINLCVCCTHIEHMEQCKMDVGCSRCAETGCPCRDCHGGSNWQRKSKDKEED